MNRTPEFASSTGSAVCERPVTGTDGRSFAEKTEIEAIHRVAQKNVAVVAVPKGYFKPKKNLTSSARRGRGGKASRNVKVTPERLLQALGFDTEMALPVWAFLFSLFTRLGFQFKNEDLAQAISHNGGNGQGTMKPSEIVSMNGVLKLDHKAEYSLNTLVTTLGGWLAVKALGGNALRNLHQCLSRGQGTSTILLGVVATPLRERSAIDASVKPMTSWFEFQGAGRLFQMIGKVESIPADYQIYAIDPGTTASEAIRNAIATGTLSANSIALVNASYPHDVEAEYVGLVREIEAIKATIYQNGRETNDVAEIKAIQQILTDAKEEAQRRLNALKCEVRSSRYDSVGTPTSR